MKRLILIASACALAACSYGDIYDLGLSFDEHVNPNGPWEYGRGYGNPSIAIGYQRNTILGSNAFGWNGFLGPLGDSDGFVGVTSGSPEHGIPNRSVVLCPGDPGNPDAMPYSVVTWHIPQQGFVRVVGTFGAGDSGAVDLYIKNIGITNWSRINATGDESFDLDLGFLHNFYELQFIVAPHGNVGTGATPLDLHIIHDPVPAPEPASCAALLLGLTFVARRRKK